jgi:ELP3 family radical SAM enzyme/protein acetyltransferase
MKCSYCPSEFDASNGTPTQPKSYISSEPAMMRALNSNFDIGGQICDRLVSYLRTGNINNVETKNKKKIEVILSGGTWDVMPLEYRTHVINELFYGFNVFGPLIHERKERFLREEKSLNCPSFYDMDEIKKEYKLQRAMLSIAEEIAINESEIYGVIGLSIETRPDHITRRNVKQYLQWGITRVQIGIQHFDDGILTKIKRDCYLKDTINAIRLLKQVGLKIVIHLMPDLPGSSPELDRWMFKEAVENPDLQIDDMKIYPCAVIKSHDPKYIVTSDISEWYDKGEYIPYSETNLQDLIDVLIEFKKKVPRWVRIERLIRDIPAQSMTAGYGKISNLRQIIEKQMQDCGEQCHCIRCMEIRNREYDFYRLSVRPYKASEGMEYHIGIDIENNKYHYDWLVYLFWYWLFYLISFGKTKLFYEGSDQHYIGTLGFCRLRIDPEPGLEIVSELEGCGLIRELHVYGQAVCVGEESISTQHKGFGSLLMKTAETIIVQNGLRKSAVIAGVGARDYYKNKHNYSIEGTYMTKNL